MNIGLRSEAARPKSSRITDAPAPPAGGERLRLKDKAARLKMRGVMSKIQKNVEILPADPAAGAAVARGVAGKRIVDSKPLENEIRNIFIDLRISRAEAAGDVSAAGLWRFYKSVRASQIVAGARRFDAAAAEKAIRAGLAAGAGRKNIEDLNAARQAQAAGAEGIVRRIDQEFRAAGGNYAGLSKSTRAQLIEKEMKKSCGGAALAARSIRRMLD